MIPYENIMNIVRLPTKRGNFTSISYKEHITPELSKNYQEKRSKMADAFNTVELLTVIEGVRDSYLTFISSDEVEKKRAEMAKYGLVIVLLDKEAPITSYGNHSMPYVEGQKYVWRSIITSPKLVEYWEDIWKQRSENFSHGEYLIGRGLGYPHCCAKFFCDVWYDNSGQDTTWQQAVNTHNYFGPDKIITLGPETPIWASNLLRWVGHKLISHLPCSFHCSETKDIALKNIGVATQHGFGNQYHTMCQMLDWEISWTAQYGIATIETPDFIINTITDITTDKYTVIKQGNKNSLVHNI